MTTVVFSGPSVSGREVASLLPGATVAPPVRHGDLLRLDVGPGDRVVIVDGVFHQSASVRHKEIGALLAAGVQVWGVASMGALRAAELGPYGMRGAGTVHRLYTLGILDRDDEVAVVHTEPDQGSRALTVALVSVRVLARWLTRRRRVTTAVATQLVAAADELPFPERTWTGILAAARLSESARATVAKAVQAPAAEWDVKARDALRLLRCLATEPVAETASVPRALLPHTVHTERWSRTARPADDRLVTAAGLYALDYPLLYRRTVLGLIGGTEPLDDPAPALQAVAARNLTPRGDDSSGVLNRLVAGYRWAGGLPPTPALAAAVAATPATAILSGLVSAAAQLNAQLAARGRDIATVSRAALLAALCRRWETDDLDRAAALRGYRDLDELVEHTRWLAPQLLLAPPPPIALYEPHVGDVVTGS